MEPKRSAPFIGPLPEEYQREIDADALRRAGAVARAGTLGRADAAIAEMLMVIAIDDTSALYRGALRRELTRLLPELALTFPPFPTLTEWRKE